jgi:hypothetical protein
MTMANYSGGFKDGVSIRGVPLMLTHPGKVFWVYNGSAVLQNQKGGSNGNDGSFNAPFSTLDYAVGRCTANRGDVIFVKPGHAETVSSATALALDVAGIAIIGLGTGTLRPKFTLDTIATSTIGVTAANVSLTNLVISANYADIVSAFTLGAAKYFSLDKVDVVATATNMNFLHVIDTNATTDDAQGLSVTNCNWFEPDAATLAFALVDGTNSRWNISDNVVVNGAATADIAAMFTIAAGKVLTQLTCLRNNVQITGSGDTVAGLWLTTNQTTNSGIVAYNNLKHLDATTEIWQTSDAGFGLFENRATAITTGQGYLLPAIDS